jgi:signal transduction histidine kinase
VILLNAETQTPVPKDQWPPIRSKRGEVVKGIEGIIQFSPGEEIPVLIYSTPVYVGGALAAVLLAFQDITVLKEADRAKNQFLAILSHELRTPLTNILGWAKEAREMPEIAQDALRIIGKNAEIQRRLLENLLEVSRLIHGKLVLKPEVTDLWRLAEQTMDDLREITGHRQVAVNLDPPEDALPIHGDCKRLLRVIGNLLDNAMKFSHAGGTITLKGYRQGNQAVLAIRDRGRGISQEQLPTLFELFHPSAELETTQGLRLGLALAKRVVELHGGRITVSSPGIGQGSTFTIEVPLHGTTETGG